MSITAIKIIVYLIGFIISVFTGSLVVKRIISKFADSELPHGFENAGALIGQLERCLVFLALLLNSYTLIGIIMTLKAIYRFGDISGDVTTKMKISEYFIIGNFASLIWVLIVFIVCRLAVGYFI